MSIDVLCTLFIAVLVFVKGPFEISADATFLELIITVIFAVIPFLLFVVITLLDYIQLKKLFRRRKEFG